MCKKSVCSCVIRLRVCVKIVCMGCMCSNRVCVYCMYVHEEHPLTEDEQSTLHNTVVVATCTGLLDAAKDFKIGHPTLRYLHF